MTFVLHYILCIGYRIMYCMIHLRRCTYRPWAKFDLFPFPICHLVLIFWYLWASKGMDSSELVLIRYWSSGFYFIFVCKCDRPEFGSSFGIFAVFCISFFFVFWVTSLWGFYFSHYFIFWSLVMCFVSPGLYQSNILVTFSVQMDCCAWILPGSNYLWTSLLQ